MRIYLISPTHRNPDGSLYRVPRYWTSGLCLPYLKALTPPPHTVDYADEMMNDLDLYSNADLIGITAMGPQIGRAFELADWFRDRGKPVVMGGTWASLVPDQALEHADAVVVGEAELVWAKVLDDAAAGRLRGKYQANRWHDLRDLPRVDYQRLPLLRPDLYRRSRLYRQYFHWPVQTSRGCPHPCEFCAVQTYYRRSYRNRPVEEVVEDFRTIKRLGGHKVLLLDDNPIGHKEHAKELFRALIPLRMRWASQCTINVARDEELLALAARSGCVSLSIGLESIAETNLASLDKRFGKPGRYAVDLAAIRRRGIQVIGLIILGLDHDDPSSFRRTLQFLLDNKISLVKVYLPCPYPGTRFYEKMDEAGRIMTRDWNRYDYGGSLVRPIQLTPEQALDGFNWVYRQFYRPANLLRRFFPPSPRNLAETLFYLIGNYKIHRYLTRTPHSWGVIG